MTIIKTSIDGLIIIEPMVFNDERGYFLESYNKQKLEDHLPGIIFIQDNESKSSKGVLRGLHFQKPPFDQSKLVRCIQGEVLDVAVDLRMGSSTFGKHESIILSGDNKKQFFIPKGFAHGFIVLSKTAIFAYKVDNIYSPENESGIIWNDHEIGVDWKLDFNEIIISQKDKDLQTLNKTEIPFK
jgi:dTDP-4-dehydrorhamnose 3,5-epimerase